MEVRNVGSGGGGRKYAWKSRIVPRYRQLNGQLTYFLPNHSALILVLNVQNQEKIERLVW